MCAKNFVDGKMKQNTALDTYSVRLTAWHARQARKIGNGNMGDGIRLCIEEKIRGEELELIPLDDTN